MTQPSPTRRTVLTSAVVVGAAAAATAACGSSSAGSPAPTQTQAPAGPLTLGPTSDVPVGGAKIYATEKVVVAQPTAGKFVGFSAVCPHNGCVVDTVSDGKIACPCHGSMFSVVDGSKISGPTPSGLAPKTVTVTGADLTVA